MSSGARCLRGDQSIGARCPRGDVSKLQGGDMSTGAKCLVTKSKTIKILILLIMKGHYYTIRHYTICTIAYLGIVIHFVFKSWVVIAFSNSSTPPLFFNFFTRLLTAFSDHLSSFSMSPFFQPKRRLTIGGVNCGRADVMS